ncbi:protocadherin gamma-C5-like isoform X13 [Clupea harengus]|uniref:Protocadherin gamma-C3 n=1 Tax=Clupea harengus TaxID=7950 RepID=A0A6P3W1A6_CLUHA|nr:protocadherin gamma-C5-like isoform X13 [Clupea harengus]
MERKWRQSSEWPVLWLSLSLACLSRAVAELNYSVSEEVPPGSVVGSIAKDLGLNTQRIKDRNLRIISDSSAHYFEINSVSGALVIKEIIDREVMCGLSSTCSLHLQIVLQNPLEMHRVLVEILDVNDNAPQFPARNTTLEISEAAAPGTRFRLESAHDPDVGINSLRTYQLASNDFFAVTVETKSDGSKFPELVVEKALDRETLAGFRLLLTAVDGGQPEKSGTTLVLIKILDVNDNAPVFEQLVIRVRLLENSVSGTLVTQLNATDIDSGMNGQITYHFSKYTPDRILKLFSVDSKTGEILVTGDIDYEMADMYDVTIQARDSGTPAMEGSCNVKIEIIDVNDNTPEVTLTSLTSPIREDAEPGTVIALISAKDLDSSKNGEVTLKVASGLPFKLMSVFGEHYKLVTDGRLDREAVSEYNVVVMATDAGTPPLSSQKAFVVALSDVNDNAPTFSQSSYSVDITENNAPGTPIVTVFASDPDAGDNARLSYSILESSVHGTSVASYVYINQDNGNVFSMRSLDYEQMNAFQIHVQVRDAGTPPSTSNVTVHVFVVDQNDNPPNILYPAHNAEDGIQLTIPGSALGGHVVGKIVAVDPDSGYNAWLSYSIPPSPESALFRVDPHSGQLRTVRKLAEDDKEVVGNTYSFAVVVKDNGEPQLSSSVSVTVTVEEEGADVSSDSRRISRRGPDWMTNSTLYLIASLAAVTGVFLITMVVLLVRCLRNRSDSDCCSGRKGVRPRPSYHLRNQKDPHLQLNTDGPIRYMEVVGGPQEPYTRTYRPCYSTLSSRSDFVFVKTPMLSHNNTLNMTLTRKHLTNSANEQKPPNQDWRFNQNQRPGPSGATANPDVPVGTGPWPQPPTEAEQLQALMAAANEVSEATNTLTPGTMGLSTRYSPQFTLQHVPDYRQNVYIPGSTATLGSNPQQQMLQQQLQQQHLQQQHLQQQQQLQLQQQMLPQREALPPPQAVAAADDADQPDASKANQTPASKKKSTKKDKK